MKRAIGIVRVSQVGGREGESFVSPGEQRERIEAACKRDKLQLVAVHEELDVSGGRPLAKRPGLSAAVEAIEAGRADVIAVAYLDRLARSVSTQAEVVQRVEAAKGQVLAVDVGQVANGSAAQWLSGTMLGAVSEYVRRSAKERTAAGQKRAVARGALPFARTPLGYTRERGGTLEIDLETRPLVEHAFEMRLAGASLTEIRGMLREHGVERSHRGVQELLASRLYLGEIHYGQFVNLQAHEPIIDRDTFKRVQRIKIPRGRRSPSDRLLARLGILRCGSCGSRLSAMKLPRQGDYPIYRCASTSDCPRHVTISAVIAERVVVDAVREALADVEGRASLAENAQEAVRALKQAQERLDATLRAFGDAGLATELAAIERLNELRHARDEAQTRADELSGPHTSITVNADRDWDRLTTEEQRALIRATVARATVAPVGRGAERLSVELVGE